MWPKDSVLGMAPALINHKAWRRKNPQANDSPGIKLIAYWNRRQALNVYEWTGDKQPQQKHAYEKTLSFKRIWSAFFFSCFVILHSENYAPLQVLIYTVYIHYLCNAYHKKKKKINIFQNSISTIKINIMNFWIGGSGIPFPQILIFWTPVPIQLFDN